MQVNIRLVTGDHKDLSLTIANATKNASSAISSAPRGALNGTLRDILKPISFIARDVAFAPLNAIEKQ